MSIATAYTCDKCGQVQPTPTQFWTIGIIAREGTLPSWSLPGPDLSMQVCRPCLEALGIYRRPEIKPGEIALPPPPTLEELIVEIVRNQVTEMTGAT